MTRKRLIILCESRHEFVHLFLGLLCFFIVLPFYPVYSVFALLLIALLGSILPDIDHLFYLFIYGRKDDYSKSVHFHLRQKRLDLALAFCRQNHKSNHSIVSHNLLSLFISLAFFIIFLINHHASSAVFSLAVFSHFTFDVAEDLLVNSRLNPNWFFKFGPKK